MVRCDLIVEDDRWALLGDLDSLALRALGAASDLVPDGSGTLALLLADDAALHELNRDFLGKDRPTDVLSFPSLPMDRPFLGDIAMAYGVAASDAARQGRALADHFAHLLIHGYLHLLGFDHETDEDAARMEALEIRALQSLSIGNPYQTDLSER